MGPVLAFALLLSASAAAPAERPAGYEPGQLWELTNQMSLSGEHAMQMPAQTNSFCKPLKSDWSEPPGMDKDMGCEVLENSVTGGTSRGKVRCQGGITGEWTMTFDGQDAYKGTMTMTTPQGTMVMNMTGRNLRQDCDAGEVKRRAAAMQKQAETAQADHANAMEQMCLDSAKNGSTMMFLGPNAACKDPRHLSVFCANLPTPEAYANAASSQVPGTTLADAAAACKTDAATLQSQACAAAESKDAFSFMVRSCPQQAKALAEKQCAGRRYSSEIEPRYRDFCVGYAQEALAQQDAAQQPPADPKKQAVEKGKKMIKGLFGK